MKVLFLDMDGVVNDFTTKVLPEKMALLQEIYLATGCVAVLSSMWRRYIHRGMFTLVGFNFLLATHNLDLDVIDTIGPGEEDEEARGILIKEWLIRHPEVQTYCVVDDMRGGFDGLTIVRTNGRVGLTEANAQEIITRLGRK